MRNVAFGFERVMADDPPFTGLVAPEPDFLDPQIVTHVAVTARPRQHGLRVGGIVTRSLPGDPMAAGTTQTVQVRVRGEPSINHSHHPAETPTP